MVVMVAERTGLQRVIVRRYIELWRVRVNGGDARDVAHIPSEGGTVTLDGQPV